MMQEFVLTQEFYAWKVERVYLLVHRKDPAEDDVTIDPYQLRAVLASFLYVVTLARNQEAPHPR